MNIYLLKRNKVFFRKAFPFFTIGLLILILALHACSGSSSFKKEMLKDAEEINASAPMMIDDITRLDNAEVIKSNIFRYNYTLVNHTKSDPEIKELIERMESRITTLVKDSKKLEPYKKNKITMSYSYQDKNGVFLFRIDITPDKYTD